MVVLSRQSLGRRVINLIAPVMIWAGLGAGALAAGADPAGIGLQQVHYDIAVADYCGLIDQPVAIGYFLLHHDLLARGNVAPEDDQAARLAAIAAADLEYFDRGLSGQKNWCRTEGAAAVGRFTSYFQRRQLP